MPKLIQINSVCNNSGGHIMWSIQKAAMEEGFDTLSIYGRRKGFTDLPSVKAGNGFFFWLHVGLTIMTGRNGEGSLLSTRKMIRILKKEKPDIIHLHNMHGYYLNYPMLFHYLKYEFQGKVVWTLHDCWAYTGHCAFFTADCDKYKTGCGHCPHRRDYPYSLLTDSSAHSWNKKKESFCGLSQMTLVTPSKWLAGNVEESLLKEYPVRVIPNGLDPLVFHPIGQENGESMASLRMELEKAFGIPHDKKILLDVASAWNERKGMEVFRQLSTCMEKGELAEFCIVLVGMNAAQTKTMPSSIIFIEKTSNREELGKLYSAAEILVNPSKEESFSMVTVEALACGTPVIALDSSAVKELVPKECGIVLHQPEVKDYVAAIREIERKLKSGFISKRTLTRQGHRYTEKAQVEGYLALYRELLASTAP